MQTNRTKHLYAELHLNIVMTSKMNHPEKRLPNQFARVIGIEYPKCDGT